MRPVDNQIKSEPETEVEVQLLVDGEATRMLRVPKGKRVFMFDEREYSRVVNDLAFNETDSITREALIARVLTLQTENKTIRATNRDWFRGMFGQINTRIANLHTVTLAGVLVSLVCTVTAFVIATKIL